jgi:hypothetical protein
MISLVVTMFQFLDSIALEDSIIEKGNSIVRDSVRRICGWAEPEIAPKARYQIVSPSIIALTSALRHGIMAD